jgi:hypothetical protein
MKSAPGDVVSSIGPAVYDGHFTKDFFIWPDEDTSYVKLIWKHPTRKYPSGFHIFGTRYHPIGDFDREDVRLPDEPMRIYETRNGFRVFFTGRYNVNLNSMFDELDAMGGDPLYSKYARMRKYYACRIEPKSRPAPAHFSIARLLNETGPCLPEWRKFIEMHDQATNALATHTELV